jgi:DNA invertase Pin-like site-specific DNA recombinase
MEGKRIGYIRVSSKDQNPDRQLEGVLLDKKFIDYASAKNDQRTQLQFMLEYVREGDHVFVHSIDRMARNMSDLRRIVDILMLKRVSLCFLKENIKIDGTECPMSVLLLHVIGSIAQFERSLIRERQAEGIALAKERGAYKGRSPALNEKQTREIQELIKMGLPKSRIALKFKVTRATIYKYLRLFSNKPNNGA